jgi:Ca2+-binding RTX toxin-like protein
MATIIGTADADTLTGTPENDVIDAGAGNDTVTSGRGADIIHGGDGDDVLDGGGATTPIFNGHSGDGGGNQLYGEAGADTLSGAGGDLLDGGDGNDIIDAFASTFTRSLDPVTILGGNGNDRITLSYELYGAINAGAGDDVINLTLRNRQGWPVGAHVTLTTGAGADIIGLPPGGPVNGISTLPATIEITDFTVTGAEHDSITLIGGGNPFAGDFSFYLGQLGADTIVFQANSWNQGTTPYVVLNGVDVSSLSAVNFGGYVPGQIWTVGAATADTLTGSTAADHLFGYEGDDIIVGGGGADALLGGEGRDTFVYTAPSDSNGATYDILHDFKAGTDVLDLTALDPSNVSILHYNGGTFVFGGSGAETFQIASINNINGSDIQGLTGGVYVVGDNSVSGVLGGSQNADTIVGGTKFNTIIGGGGGDALYGGAGADYFQYTSGTDSTPGAGLDIIHDFETGVDKLSFYDLDISNVSIMRYNGGSFVSGLSGGNTFQLGSTQDINGSDVGYMGGIYMVGDQGANTLVGSSEQDSIVGGAGDDMIIGGQGADALYGGAGTDTFRYTDRRESALNTADFIHDFQSGVDKIDLSAVHTSANDVHGWVISNGATFLFVDQGGNGVNEMLIQIISPTFQASDLIW